MNFQKIESASLSNGEGWRVVLWVSGCSHHCPGCHNQCTWDPNSGKLFDEKAKEKLFEWLSKPYIKGLTLSGGDPLYQGNRKEITELCKEVKNIFPEKDIWLYTGYKFEEIKDLETISYIDVVVDGEYIEKLRDITLPFRGSSNQKIIRTKKKTSGL